MDFSTVFDRVAEWFKGVFKKAVDVGGGLISAGLGALPIPQPSSPPPANNGSGGGSTPGGNPPSSGGGFSDLFTQPVEFLRNLTEKDTWMRVGIVLVGILLIILAVRTMIRANSSAGRVDRILKEVGA